MLHHAYGRKGKHQGFELWLMIHQGVRFQNRSNSEVFIWNRKKKKSTDHGTLLWYGWEMLHGGNNQMHLTLQLPIPRKKKPWEFPKIGVPHKGWFIMENPIKTDDLGVPLFLDFHPHQSSPPLIPVVPPASLTVQALCRPQCFRFTNGWFWPLDCTQNCMHGHWCWLIDGMSRTSRYNSAEGI